MKDMQRTVNKKYMITPFLAFYLIHSMQVGIGILSFQRNTVQISGNDAWISVILAGAFIHILIWIIYKILSFGNGDIITIHYDVFGKWLGGFFSFIWIAYFFSIGVIILRSFIEVVQVWMFPGINVFFFGITLLILVYYIISGGFRVVTGICFLGVVIPAYLSLTFIYPLEYTEFRNLLPVWNHSVKDILLGTKEMTLSYLGFSTIFMFYPYFDDSKKSERWAFIGNLATTLLYTSLMILSLAYFSENYLTRNIWPTLTMWKMVEMPFVARFEYIGISSWILIILPNLCLTFWSSSRGLRQLCKFSQRKALIGILIIALIVTSILKEREHIVMITNFVSLTGLYLISFYIPFLFIFSYFRLKRRKSH